MGVGAKRKSKTKNEACLPAAPHHAFRFLNTSTAVVVLRHSDCNIPSEGRIDARPSRLGIKQKY